MKQLVRLFTVLCLFLGALGLFVLPQNALAAELGNVGLRSPMVLLGQVPVQNPVDKKLSSEFGDKSKIDLNNTNVRYFRDYPGFYPNLARKIIDNAPYTNVEEVLDIPGLSERQKQRLEANLDLFIVTDTEIGLTEGGLRYNPGVY